MVGFTVWLLSCEASGELLLCSLNQSSLDWTGTCISLATNMLHVRWGIHELHLIQEELQTVSRKLTTTSGLIDGGQCAQTRTKWIGAGGEELFF